MESTGEKCSDCGRLFALRDGEEWLSSDPGDDSNYALCGMRVWPGGDDAALIDCLRQTVQRQRVLLDNADRLAQKVMALAALLLLTWAVLTGVRAIFGS